ncbi:hypothetical protein QAD02_000625 [Eretmocerus hayati]|uniref:Uncharacterized protein n=1 Tax=Eretmocerus hayati TaxID=131215 RepID=A0ACC2NE48_9HYME|nr:hypothetical protein QAD02_000625 [Eretmocerus hayati]
MNRVNTYLEAHDLQSRDIRDVIDEFCDEISKMEGTCIDIGCGPGTITKEVFMPKLPKETLVVGSDISKKMLDHAKEEYKDEKRLSFSELDIQTKKIPSNLVGAFDNAVSFYCLHWCQDIRQVFGNIHQLLRPGGKSLVLFLASNTGFDTYLSLSENPLYKPYMQDVHKYIPYFQHSNNPRMTLKKIIEESGLQVLHCSCREKTFIFNSLSTLEKHAQAVNPFTPRMPAEIRKKFETDQSNDMVRRKISFVSGDDESENNVKVLDRYHVLVAYFEKPSAPNQEKDSTSKQKKNGLIS